MFDGTIIRKLRKEKNLSLKELSEKSGVSIAMISQIERGNADPTMTTLYKICEGLNTTITSLIVGEQKPERVVRKNSRRTLFLPNSKVKYQLLTSHLKKNLEMILVELEPKQQDRQLISHQGEEVGFILQGQLTIILGDEEYVLEEGDSITFESTIPHRFINHGDEKSVSIWTMTPPSF